MNDPHSLSIVPHLPNCWWPSELVGVLIRYESHVVALSEFANRDPMPRTYCSAAVNLLCRRQDLVLRFLKHLHGSLQGPPMPPHELEAISRRQGEARICAHCWRDELAAGMRIAQPFFDSERWRWAHELIDEIQYATF